MAVLSALRVVLLLAAAAVNHVQVGAVQLRIGGHNNKSDEDSKNELCTGSYFTQASGWPDCAANPWKPPTVAGTTHELCANGRALPRLYILGAQKTGTSSMANDLACAGVFPVPSASGNEKEFSYFVGRMKWRGVHDEAGHWLEQLPKCSHDGTGKQFKADAPIRMVSDMTPNNLRMVNGETTYGHSAFINVPETLLSFYGDKSTHLTLVAMIREPLARMQSAWYAARECDNHAICKEDCMGESFAFDLRRALDNAKKTEPLYTEWLWTGMYGRQLKQWLSSFDAKQMYVVPYMQYSKGDADGICQEIAKRTDFHMDCEGRSRGKGVSHSWSNAHPSLNDDLESDVRKEFEDFMHAEKELLVKLLAEGQQKGLGLANYEGKTGDQTMIRTWLEAWW